MQAASQALLVCPFESLVSHAAALMWSHIRPMCHALERRTNDPDSASVAETVQHFITAMDSLRINLVAVDQVGCMFTAQFSTFVACGT